MTTAINLYIPSITDMQRAVLKKCLVELCRQFGITRETDISKLVAKQVHINFEIPEYKMMYIGKTGGR